MGYLYASDVNGDSFRKVVESIQGSGNLLVMYFKPDEAGFKKFDGDVDAFIDSDEGRLFSSGGELRWMKMDGMFRVVYLGIEPFESGLEDCSNMLEPLKPDYSRIYLWGERTDQENEWIEQKVPHRFVYPLDKKPIARGRVQLIVEDWRDKNGIARFSRYHSIEEVGEK